MASPIFILNPPPGFSVLAIVRGIQLALLGAYRSLQNPALFRSVYYQQALTAIKYSIILQCIVWVPVVALRIFFKLLSIVFRRNADLESLVHTIEYFQRNVLNVGVFVISAIRFFRPELDNLFLTSLQFIDGVYVQKHPDKAHHQYHPNLVELSTKLADVDPKPQATSWIASIRAKYAKSGEFSAFLQRYLNNVLFNILVYMLCRVPKIGPVILGLISFQNFNEKVGSIPAIVIFIFLQLVPKHYSMLFLSIYWGSRNMIHDLLLPYFIRLQFSKSEKEQWIKAREGLLFGFGLCYYFLIYQFPWVGILIYGFAESSIAYLITKVSDPPPNNAGKLINWISSQLVFEKEKEQSVLKGHFSKDEGFTPIPGSFIVDL